MLNYMYIGNIQVPSYGMIVAIGVVLCNVIAECKMRIGGQRIKDFYFLELVSGIGAIMGAKALFISKQFTGLQLYDVSWEIIRGAGYSYYGGLAGFLLCYFVFGKLYHVNVKEVARQYLFLLPLLYAIWRIGCFMGGCCYGIPYDGVFSVCYPEGVNSVAGVQVFPVQLLEAVSSLVIMIILLMNSQREKGYEQVGMYLFLYGVSRFFIEYVRYHGNQSIVTTGQMYSLICGGIGAILMYREQRRRISHE